MKNKLIICAIVVTSFILGFTMNTLIGSNSSKNRELYGSYQNTDIITETGFTTFTFDVDGVFTFFTSDSSQPSGNYKKISENSYQLEFLDGTNVEIVVEGDAFYFPVVSESGSICIVKFHNSSEIPMYVTLE